MKENGREANIELLRIVAMLMVTMMHILGHGGILKQYDFVTTGYMFFWLIETFCYVAVNEFVLITGYFMVISPVKPSRIIRMAIQVETYSLFCLVVAKYFFHCKIGLTDILSAIFPLSWGSYWFASVYVVLILLVPLLNLLVRAMNRQIHLFALVQLTLLYSVIPSFAFWSTDVLSGGSDILWFVVLYLTAAYIRLYASQNTVVNPHEKLKALVGYIICVGGGSQAVSCWDVFRCLFWEN